MDLAVSKSDKMDSVVLMSEFDKINLICKYIINERTFNIMRSIGYTFFMYTNFMKHNIDIITKLSDKEKDFLIQLGEKFGKLKTCAVDVEEHEIFGFYYNIKGELVLANNRW